MSALALALLGFCAAASVVWWAGTRLPRHVVALSERTGLGQAFAGMLVMGGITSLPEMATATSAAALGSSQMALNNIIGSASFNILLLALADMVLGKQALTSVLAKPVTLIQGLLSMLLLGLVVAAIVVGSTFSAFGIGPWSLTILLFCLFAIRVAHRAERRPMWIVVNPPDLALVGELDEGTTSLRKIAAALGGLAALILVAGLGLAYTGDIIARESGLGGGLIGLVLAAAATSLPELSAITGAMRNQRYELAVGEIFGSNMFNIALIFLVDLAAPGPPVLAAAGSFEILAALLALLMSGIFVLGLIERRDHTFLRMGEDSIAVILVYAAGLTILFNVALGTR
ncbi:sodium:calcium antiporter [Altererythrobacter sp. ZODW24]|uniref:sodium:calcium antiporter n=1 Tax=Altererythrobacter sp. ZODW24 TaxID=2185142 RepID=UPI000DF7BA9A|nr:sodium:calcium antiporter [Altererythrobacter sp. ZODW24]